MNELRVDDAAKSISPDGTLPAAGSGGSRARWQTPEVEELRISSAASGVRSGLDAGIHSDTSLT